ncbi:hypothetical protein PAPYR_2115 [Paratrimastix pyriformis]|uniref:TRAF-type domain-containing protein n=1 Tax=Paratrimastix pyriformis TaxID=342808 RepID=A0ABQ8USL4_9EUKA|nr:hypothetical protein PAPYR_2115 [Paratrimastix pyriformis]
MRDDLVAPFIVTDRTTTDLIGELEIRCVNQKAGCSWVGPVSQLDHHERAECTRREVTCSNQGCGKTMPAHTYEEHQLGCPHRTVPCPFCNTPIEQIQKAEHESNCPQRVIECRQCGHRLAQGDYPHHIDTTCPKTLVPCPIPGCTDMIAREALCTARHFARHKENITSLEESLAALGANLAAEIGAKVNPMLQAARLVMAHEVKAAEAEAAKARAQAVEAQTARVRAERALAAIPSQMARVLAAIRRNGSTELAGAEAAETAAEGNRGPAPGGRKAEPGAEEMSTSPMPASPPTLRAATLPPPPCGAIPTEKQTDVQPTALAPAPAPAPAPADPSPPALSSAPQPRPVEATDRVVVAASPSAQSEAGPPHADSPSPPATAEAVAPLSGRAAKKARRQGIRIADFVKMAEGASEVPAAFTWGYTARSVIRTDEASQLVACCARLLPWASPATMLARALEVIVLLTANPPNTAAFGAAGAIPVLLNMLRHPDLVGIVDRALEALDRLAADLGNRAACVRLRAIPALASMLERPGLTCPVVARALAVITTLSSCGGPPCPVLVEGIIPILIEMVTRPYALSSVQAIQVLVTLSATLPASEAFRPPSVPTALGQTLLRLVDSGQSDLITRFLRVLVNLSAGPDADRLGVPLTLQVLGQILGKAALSDTPMAREAHALLANLARFPSLHVLMVGSGYPTVLRLALGSYVAKDPGVSLPLLSTLRVLAAAEVMQTPLSIAGVFDACATYVPPDTPGALEAMAELKKVLARRLPHTVSA